MWRSLATITAAIQFSGPPSMSKATAERYAVVVQGEAKVRGFDPLTLIAMVHNESRWHASAVNGVNCIGLGQVCLSNYPYCRSNLNGVECQAKKKQLLDGAYNLRVVSDSITRNREFCWKKTGKPVRWPHWLMSHGGWNSPSRNLWCGKRSHKGRWVDLPLPSIVQRIMRYQKQLVRRFSR